VKVGVIGAGYWGANLIRVCSELGILESVCDANEAAIAKIAEQYPEAGLEFEISSLLERDIDAVVIAAPAPLHAELALEAIAAGKHVFVEKPLAASSAQVMALMRLAAAAGVVLMPGHTFLYSPSVTMIRRLIESGELGEIYFVSTSRVNLGLHQSDVSVAWDLGPHDFSILRHWLGETPIRVSALARGCIIPGIPDVAFIDLEYASGTLGHVELSWLSPSKLRRTTIVGSRKMIIYDDTSAEPVRVFDSGATLPDPANFGEYKLTYRTGDILSPHVEAVEPVYDELRDFCDAITTGTTPRSSAELGLDVVRTIEAVDASLAGGGNPVAVPSPEPAYNDHACEPGPSRRPRSDPRPHPEPSLPHT
jgi:predicted dehydrogenase